MFTTYFTCTLPLAGADMYAQDVRFYHNDGVALSYQLRQHQIQWLMQTLHVQVYLGFVRQLPIIVTLLPENDVLITKFLL